VYCAQCGGPDRCPKDNGADILRIGAVSRVSPPPPPRFLRGGHMTKNPTAF